MGRGEKSWSILSQHAVFWKLNEAKVKQRLTLWESQYYCLGLVSMKPPHCVNPTVNSKVQRLVQGPVSSVECWLCNLAHEIWNESDSFYWRVFTSPRGNLASTWSCLFQYLVRNPVSAAHSARLQSAVSCCCLEACSTFCLAFSRKTVEDWGERTCLMSQ